MNLILKTRGTFSIIILISALLISCINTNNNNTQTNKAGETIKANEEKKETEKDNKQKIFVEVEKLKAQYFNNKDKISKSNVQVLINEYNNSSFFEIRVASWLFNNINKVDETYESYLGNTNFYKNLISKMFCYDDNLNNTLVAIESNSKIYINELRDVVKQSYNRYHAIESKEFYALLVLRDTLLLEIVNNYMLDSLTDIGEKESVIKYINKYYPELLCKKHSHEAK